jgi:cell wall-associated NlpC family hydrolase
VLGQASLLLQVEGTHNMQAQQFLNLANELSTIKQQRQRTADGVAQLEAQYAAQKASMTKLLDNQTSLLRSLTEQQQAAVAAQTVGGSVASSAVTTTPVAYTGTTATQAGKAVAFAYAQLGKPYVWGATGPDTYDCSGLMLRAFQKAGVNLPRVSRQQYNAGGHVPVRQAQPGDLLFLATDPTDPATIHHVMLYMGNDKIVEAPYTGAQVRIQPAPWNNRELVSLATRPGTASNWE